MVKLLCSYVVINQLCSLFSNQKNSAPSRLRVYSLLCVHPFPRTSFFIHAVRSLQEPSSMLLRWLFDVCSVLYIEHTSKRYRTSIEHVSKQVRIRTSFLSNIEIIDCYKYDVRPMFLRYTLFVLLNSV